jgi:hypothetical protein
MHIYLYIYQKKRLENAISPRALLGRDPQAAVRGLEPPPSPTQTQISVHTNAHANACICGYTFYLCNHYTIRMYKVLVTPYP